MTADNLAVYYTSPCQTDFLLPGRLKQYSTGIFTCGIWGSRLTWLATFFLTYKTWVMWWLHCPSSRGHCWKDPFALEPQRQRGEGCSTTPLCTFKWQETFLQCPSQTSEMGWLGRAIVDGHRKGRNSNPIFTSLLNLGDDRSTFPFWQSLRVSSDIYVTGKAYNMYTVV